MTKKNIRKIPRHIIEQVKASPDREWVAGCAMTFTRKELEKGCLAHLGISLADGVIQTPDSALPPIHRGKYSRRNAQGYAVIRRDLPKEPNYQPHEVPSWGSRHSTHTVYLPHPKYPRDIVAPKLTEISVDWSNQGSNSDQVVLSFRVDEPFSATDSEFENTLLSNLNLLQENIGTCGIQFADRPVSEYVKTLHVNWEILPPGTVEEVITRLFPGNTGTKEDRETAADRYTFFETLSPLHLVSGTSGFRRYFGAVLKSGVAIFENLHYGNAVYIFFSDWERLSQLSRIELLSGRQGKDVVRVIHTPGWQEAVRNIIRLTLRPGA